MNYLHVAFPRAQTTRAELRMHGCAACSRVVYSYLEHDYVSAAGVYQCDGLMVLSFRCSHKQQSLRLQLHHDIQQQTAARRWIH